MILLGAILRGGESRRFGSDKGAADLGGVTLVERVANALGPQVTALIACGGPAPGLLSIPDRPQPGLGPLGGIAAALHFATLHGFEGVLTVPCDAPLLPATLYEELAPGPSFLLEMPVIGLWPARLAAALDQHIATTSLRSVIGWAAAARARSVERSTPIVNVNTRADLAALEAASGNA